MRENKFKKEHLKMGINVKANVLPDKLMIAFLKIKELVSYYVSKI